MDDGALAGLRLIGLGGGRAAAVCAQLLADHGCEVIVVVPPAGLSARPSESAAAAGGRGSQSVGIEFHQPEGARLVQQLLRKADFLLLGTPPTPAVAASASDSGLIRIELTQALPDAEATTAGLFAAFGAAIALQHRQRTGEGQSVRVPPAATADRAGPDAVLPQLDLTPGGVRWPPPAHGAHTAQVLEALLGLSADDLARLRRAGIL